MWCPMLVAKLVFSLCKAHLPIFINWSTTSATFFNGHVVSYILGMVVGVVPYVGKYNLACCA
jgi:hypothetical protein